MSIKNNAPETDDRYGDDYLDAAESSASLARVGRDTGLLLGGSIGGKFLGLSFNLLAARMVGETLFGLYALALTVINYLATLATFGLDQGLVRYTAIHCADNNDRRLAGDVTLGLSLGLGLAVAGCLALLGGAPWLSGCLFHKPELSVVLRWLAASLPCLVLANLFFGISQGLRAMAYTPAVRDMIFPITKLAVAGALFAGGWTLGGMVAGHLVSAGVSAVAAMVFLRRLLHNRFQSAPLLRGSSLISYSFPLFASDFVMKSLRWSDVLFLGAFRGAGDIGLYRVAQITSEISRVIYQAFKTSFAPTISVLHHQAEHGRLRRHFKVVSKWAFAVSFPPLLFFTVMAKESLGLFGPSFVKGAVCLIILNAGRMIAVSTGLSANLIAMSGHSRWTLGNAVFGNAVAFILNATLIAPYGIIGAALAFASAASLLNIVQLLQVRWLFGFTPYYAGYLKPLTAALAAAALARWSYAVIGLTGVPGLASAAFSFLLVYSGGLWLMGLPPEDKLIVDQAGKRIRAGRRP